jgi:hypothetical protein
LGGLHISSGQSLYFSLLKRAIIVVETFTASASRSSQIGKVLELPVSPASQMLIANITNLSDFFNACTTVKACTELTDEQRNTVPLSIFVSGRETLRVPILTGILVRRVRLSSGTNCGVKLATVGVIIQNMDWGTIFSTWGSSETKVPNNSSQNTHCVGELSWLKEHDL